MIAIAKKCGICQQNKMLNSIQAGISSEPVAAVHPPTGGNAPGIEPIMVFQVVIRLLGVYTTI